MRAYYIHPLRNNAIWELTLLKNYRKKQIWGSSSEHINQNFIEIRAIYFNILYTHYFYIFINIISFVH